MHLADIDAVGAPPPAESNCDGDGAAMAVIMISTAAESDYAGLFAESPAAGFLAKAELSAAGIRRILVGEHR